LFVKFCEQCLQTVNVA